LLDFFTSGQNPPPPPSSSPPPPPPPLPPPGSCSTPTALAAPTFSGGAWFVPAGGDFQKALNNALPGDLITLAPGATFKGPFTLPNKPGASFITVRSAASDSSLPPAGTRITPAYAGALPKIVSPPGCNLPALQTERGAHHFQLIGVEILQANDGVPLE